MNNDCTHLRPHLTEHLLLGTPLPRDLTRHLNQCPDCTREATELDDVIHTLRHGDPLAGLVSPHADDPEARPSEDLWERIRRGTTEAETVAVRPVRRRRRIALGVAAAFVTAAAFVVPFTETHDQTPAHTTASVVLVRDGKMTEHPWGTEVPVALSGLKAGETYRMMAANASGTRLPGGSVRVTTDKPITTTMTTAMRKDTITALIVEDAHGHVVTRVPVTPRPSA